MIFVSPQKVSPLTPTSSVPSRQSHCPLHLRASGMHFLLLHSNCSSVHSSYSAKHCSRLVNQVQEVGRGTGRWGRLTTVLFVVSSGTVGFVITSRDAQDTRSIFALPLGRTTRDFRIAIASLILAVRTVFNTIAHLCNQQVLPENKDEGRGLWQCLNQPATR